ncbi:hypothetical protein BTM25_51810 [Actinomadura rubteroloni]|uniref:Uncharacterized protein n=1 Tax=Actinomadura rubteroloni TaxID=1926885 RepID=A0A2P4UD46_9ACTN|nr:hypothetical protein [Actinomadura rubteroloni]POM22975.1 hypothetical protein BTM25_51810 [Actinomadura rubteroloni]
MDRERVIASDTPAETLPDIVPDAARIERRIAAEHPAARELTAITAVQDGPPHRLWLDEDAGLLLHLSPESPALRCIRVRNPAWNRVLAALMERPLERLAAPGRRYRSRAHAAADLGALADLFRARLVRLRAARDDPAAIVRAARDQIARARDEEDQARRRAFLGWYLRHAFGDGPGAATAAAAVVGDEPVGALFTAWPDYCAEVKAMVADDDDDLDEWAEWAAARRGALRRYHEFRTVGRRLDGARVAALRAAVPDADIGPGRLLFDRMIDPDREDLGWDPGRVFGDCFDAGLSFDQRGPRSLRFRLPGSLARRVEPYRILFGVALAVRDGDVVVELERYEEDRETAYAGTDPAPWLAELLPLRAALLDGDLRALHLAWAHGAQERHNRDRAVRPHGAPALDPDAFTPELHALDRFLNAAP